MNSELVQAILEVIFSRYMLYLAPVLFLFAVLMFSERIIELIINAVTGNDRNRRWG